ncbi:MAG: ABC transporter permease [Roseibium album]|uniref:Ribose transport system permease protein RbsC n=1 Tax=Roseibium album TaxID=311410 RepID=A0A0M7A0S3_9HYPH|nr:ABC transporter permease [Roseibium album]MBG6142481.1 ribose transport system permease protein/inositol transport system permease protein [Labrenzia sp. EL_142]MBG6159125.1 ribose transport system permease protein/inositol transport system permease protein [Labrenzia sp. EL_162]MBG6165279.1 ribose transport system permease protein/inositol transport system permease protein [Labrenzia sp. EL_195]MBG6177489.1 ribose transport system permease protein/inositol transport system permease protein 
MLKFLERTHVRVESLAVLLALIIVMAFLSPVTGSGVRVFLTANNFFNIILASATFGILAIGATFVISSAGIDLSLGSVLGLASVTGAALVVTLELPWYFAIIGSLMAGAAAGAVNGFIITRGHVPAFIVTLGMLGIARGLALIISSGRGIYGLPEEILFLGQARPFGVPTPVFIMLFVALASHYVLAHTPFGHHTLALGDNENSARATGINIRRQRMMLYTISGLMAGIAGLIFTARVNTGDPTAGLNYELLAITAAIIGGTNLFGGRGSILGTMIGALIMGVLQNGLNLMAVQAYYQQMAIGAVLIAAVWLDQIRTRGRSLQ